MNIQELLDRVADRNVATLLAELIDRVAALEAGAAGAAASPAQHQPKPKPASTRAAG